MERALMSRAHMPLRVLAAAPYFYAVTWHGGAARSPQTIVLGDMQVLLQMLKHVRSNAIRMERGKRAAG
eukprot:9625654-Alexandrium_andersonii.AAC.1